MNKQFKFFLTSAAIAAALVGAVSCQKDLSGDVDKLNTEVQNLKAQLETLQGNISNGEVIQSITPTSDGLKIVTNKGEYAVKNGTNGTNGKDGTDGTPGSVVKIGSNGNWFIDDKDTGVKAKGEDGKDGVGTPGADGKNGDYYVPNADGKFDKYTYDASKKEYVKEATTISYLAPGTITAVWENETLTLYGVKGFEGGYILNLLTNLKGLAFVPEKIFDGLGLIEVTELMVPANNNKFPFVNPQGALKFLATAPTEVTYRMDAANIDVAKYKWDFINRKVYTKVADADKTDLIKIESGPEKTNTFVSFKIQLTKTVEPADHGKTNDIVALRAIDADKEPVVSDYAYIEKVVNKGYALVHKDGYKKADPRYYRVLPDDVLIDDPTEYNADEEGIGQGINVTEAGALGGTLNNPATPVLILGEKETLELTDYVETYAKELKDLLSNYGINPVYKFAFAGFDEDNELVMDLKNPTDAAKAEYLSDDADVTNQNDFVLLEEDGTVTINPKYAKDKTARPALGRTPLVYVRSFYGGYVLAEGFIKLEIREDAKEEPKVENYKIFIRHSAEFDYDDIPAEGTYGEGGIGKDFVDPNEKYNYDADDFEKVRELNVGWEEMNLKVFKELEMSFEEFQTNYIVDEPVIILAYDKDKKVVQPGDLAKDEAKYDDEALKSLVARDDFASVGDLATYYGPGLTINKLSPANWKQNTNIVDLTLDPEVEISGPHFVYVVYKAKNPSESRPDVVVKFVYNVKHDHEYTLSQWLLNPDYILGNQDELNPKVPDYKKSYAPYNKDKYGWGAVRIKGQDPSQEHPMRSGLTEHFVEYMINFIPDAINEESIYRFEIKNYAIDEVDWEECEFRYETDFDNTKDEAYADGKHAYIELTGEELIDVIQNPGKVPYIYLNTDEALIAKGYDVLIEVTESCEKFAEDEDYKPVYGYYYVVFKALDAKIKLYNVKLGTFKDVNDYVYAHELVEGIYDEYDNKIFEWDDEAGAWAATEAAETYGITDENIDLLTVEVKSVLDYPWDTEDSFGSNLYPFAAGDALDSPTPGTTTDSGINWWNLGTDLQVDKKAQFTIVVLWGEAPAEPAQGEEGEEGEEEEEVEDTRDILCQGDGTVIVLATANSIHPLHDAEGAIWEPVLYDITDDEYKPVFKAVKELPAEEEDGE